MATLGKALGSYGAFAAGSDALVESLIQFSRNYIYTTTLPPYHLTTLPPYHLTTCHRCRQPWRRDAVEARGLAAATPQ